MLEMAYETWVNVCTGWHVILNRAEATSNQGRIALARSKVAECEAEIRRIEALLRLRSDSVIPTRPTLAATSAVRATLMTYRYKVSPTSRQGQHRDSSGFNRRRSHRLP